MTTTVIKLKRTETEGSVPDSSYLEIGEVAVNVTDKKMFMKNSGGSVVEIANANELDNLNTSIIPSANNTYDLGSPEKRFKDLYLSGSTIFLEGLSLSKNNETNDLLIAPATVNAITGAIEIQTAEQKIFATENYVTDAISSKANTVMLDAKANTNMFALVSFSGSYNDLISKPTIPTAISELTNDTGYITSYEAQSFNDANNSLYLNGANSEYYLNYDNFNNTPTIPSAVSDLTNDTGYITAAELSGYASESYVTTQITNLIGNAPEALDTLQELSYALSNDASFSATVITSLSEKANTSDLSAIATSGSFNDLSDIPSPTITLGGDLSGSLTLSSLSGGILTASVENNSHNHIINNIDGLQEELDIKANTSSPEFTGTPTAPTPSLTDSSNTIATTEFVQTLVDDSSFINALIFG